MASEMRQAVWQAMEYYQKKISPLNRGWKVLEVGINGDPRPGGNYKYFGVGNDYKTLDSLEATKPDILADICDTGLPEGEWDLIILSQTLEHIFDFMAAIEECFRLLKPGGFLIIDCPFIYPYHGTDNYDDYWRISHKAMARLLDAVGFEFGKAALFDNILTSALARKPQ